MLHIDICGIAYVSVTFPLLVYFIHDLLHTKGPTCFRFANWTTNFYKISKKKSLNSLYVINLHFLPKNLSHIYEIEPIKIYVIFKISISGNINAKQATANIVHTMSSIYFFMIHSNKKTPVKVLIFKNVYFIENRNDFRHSIFNNCGYFQNGNSHYVRVFPLINRYRLLDRLPWLAM